MGAGVEEETAGTEVGEGGREEVEFGEESRVDLGLGEFAEEEEGVDVGWLRGVDGGDESCAVEEGESGGGGQGEGELAEEVGHAETVHAPCDAGTDTAFETLSGVGGVPEAFVVASDAEPGFAVACPCGGLKVAECAAGVLGGVFGESTRGEERGAVVN